MWIAILGGVAVGLVLTMFVIVRQERGYRLLFADTHLKDLAGCLETARAATFGGGAGAATTTYEGVGVAFERLPRHVALTLTTKRPIAPAAAGFLCGFALECARKPTPVAALQLDRRRWALVFEAAALDGTAPFVTSDEALPALRAGAADQMRALVITEASLAAYR